MSTSYFTKVALCVFIDIGYLRKILFFPIHCNLSPACKRANNAILKTPIGWSFSELSIAAQFQ